MKIALITDSHAGIRNDNPAFHQYQKKCFDWFFSILDGQGIKSVIHLGDIYDRRKYCNILTSKRLRVDFLNRLEDREIETHILSGNHDQYYKNDHEVNSLDELISGRYKHIHTYGLPSVIDFDGVDIQLLPWITKSNEKECFQAIENPKARFLMGHLEIHGIQMFRGSISDHGLDRSLFAKFDRVFSGHYHHRSTIGNITYLGAFAEYTWSDYNDPRGFSIFDTETGELEFHRNPFRMFLLVKYDDLNNPKIVEFIHSTDFTDYTDTYVKIVVVNKTNPYAFDLFFDSIYKVNPLDIQIIEDPSVLIDNEEDVELDQAESTPEILKKYIGGLTLPVDNGKMSTYMMDIYQEALTVENS